MSLSGGSAARNVRSTSLEPVGARSPAKAVFTSQPCSDSALATGRQTAGPSSGLGSRATRTSTNRERNARKRTPAETSVRTRPIVLRTPELASDASGHRSSCGPAHRSSHSISLGVWGAPALHGAGSHEMAFDHQRLHSVHQPDYRSLRRNASAASATSTAASRSDVSTGHRTATSFPAASEEGTVARAAGEYVPRGFQIDAIDTSA